MTQASVRKQLPANERIFVALDVSSRDAARDAMAALSGTGVGFKVGLQLFTAAGPEIVREISEAGHRVFLDLKFHDIPNTVASAVVGAADLGVWMMNVHALGGREMMMLAAERLTETCVRRGIDRPRLIGVTVLTSSDDEILSAVGVTSGVDETVVKLATLASACGLDGVVASARESRSIREAIANRDFLIVTPGIRPASATNDDQKRVTTPAEALDAGSDYLVIGRPILGAPDPAKALAQIVDEISAA
jgi:orotidine-5'-phosphate decarboxylase